MSAPGPPRDDGAVLDHLLAVAADPDAGLDPADRLDRYELGETLGEGAMGTVVRAHDRLLDREVAVKVLRAADPDGVLAGRLRREARVLARLEHPGIVPVHDAGRLPDGRPFYVMRRVRGRRLDEVAAELPLAERLRVLAAMCQAVAFAHARGVLHRDVKPENVMIGGFGEVLLMDWGIAKLVADADGERSGSAAPVDAGATAHGAVLGTPGYMAPEQARGEAVDGRADVHGLGAVLGFLLAADGAPVPAPLRSIVARATAPDPARRYADAGELADEVARFLEHRPVRAHREGPVARLRRWLVRYRVPVALVGAYLVMRVVLLLVLGR